MSEPYGAVLFANQAFYHAFNSRDADFMDRIWARHAPVACIHPGWDPLVGREAVMESWRQIFANTTGGTLQAQEERTVVSGDHAYVLTYEVIGEQPLIATNLFVREEGEWRMVHHQAGPCQSVPPAPEGPSMQ
ncbi:MAG TPA: nuclear transport factor 2 family protein [Gammaproteobacteria bacterium]|nr:nuclear transport factor 2 family protein [Gammaproteobacteria bacterium]